MILSKKLRGNLMLTLIYTILVITTIIILYPVYWIFIGSLNPGDSLFQQN